MKDQWKPAVMLLAVFTVLTGLAYPLLITVLAQAAFPYQANGSIIVVDGRAVGSELIGQPFAAPEYFWSRPSATTMFPYNAAASSGSNYGPLSEELLERARARARALREADPTASGPIPVDLLTGSGSGLDPDITPAGALYQVTRVARARGLDTAAVRDLIGRHTEDRWLGLLGEPRVNVLRLNLALDSLSGRRAARASLDTRELSVGAPGSGRNRPVAPVGSLENRDRPAAAPAPTAGEATTAARAPAGPSTTAGLAMPWRGRLEPPREPRLGSRG